MRVSCGLSRAATSARTREATAGRDSAVTAGRTSVFSTESTLPILSPSANQSRTKSIQLRIFHMMHIKKL